ncbi:dihydrolipoyl dehydrogenase [Heyndrickxia oleronia]|jgi:dihydrolipoamide dehydrogenase|uniref:dihydrolipoyl dehydrogenase n=1 Tax=Heyndrickxia oleronia TaxID=38875 RepID=UPI00242E2AE8|nr:dihydrolipoyl dehydrogenase [Heyndrickxia oleronia]MCI1591956.1 dihydrolipoyl dehydrogenase [Heyndrickxia oleronia]MCI1613898.1 dihydrolipoyl dehydrogenase [Heyndrickxia oleronia]MCI1745133.1 dihydrolipoyl dehydrogenase [Heyndrickxia oleronia]MCI1760870.1 dihydrolipoyl dehydrogenase [Heyndrickxia oleronia]
MVVGEIAQEKEVVVIGGGPGGYTAAIRAAQLGKDVLLIEQNHLGGVCLNEGCIPSKTFVHAAKQANRWGHLQEIGYQFEVNHFQFETYQSYKEKIVSQLRSGVEALCKANKIEVMYGHASFISENKLGIENGHHFEVVNFEQAIIATGAKPVYSLESETYQLNSRQLFNLQQLPKELILIGSNYIVLEAAFAYQALGTKVTIIMEEHEGFSFDQEIEKELRRQMKKRNISFYSGVKNVELAENENGIECSFVSEKNERTLISAELFYKEEAYVGNIEELGFERLGVSVDQHQFITCDNQGRTNIPNLFAVGDVTGGPFFATKAIKQGKVASEILCGQSSELDFTWMPEVIHTQPPIATVGTTEEEAKSAGYSVKTGIYPLPGNGYAMFTGNRDGLVKVIIEKESQRLLGMHMIGEGAIELISTAVISGEMVARDEDLIFPTYAHPSLNEGILEAMEDTLGIAIHKAPKKGKKVLNR